MSTQASRGVLDPAWQRAWDRAAILSLHGETRHVGGDQWVSFKVERGDVPVTPETVGRRYRLILDPTTVEER